MDDDLKMRIKKAQKGDIETLDNLVKDNYGLVYKISRRFENRGYDMEDIYQIGAIGLIKAIKKFDFSYNVVLSTFAVTYIIGEIKRFIRDDGPVKVSRELKLLAAKIEIEKKENPNITIGELEKNLNVDKESLVLAIDSKNALESLEGKLDEDGMCLLDRLGSNEENEEKIVERITLNDYINKLNSRDKEIIFLRYYKGQTQAKVAKIIGISQVQVSRLEKKVLTDLRNKMKNTI